MSADDLTALLESRKWVKRRVDRIEFLDLMTVRRTIVFTFDPWALAEACPPNGSTLIPLGWFAPWANARAELLDADQRVIPYLTSAESDVLIEGQIRQRLGALGVEENQIDLATKIRLHRRDPGIPGHGCKSCSTAESAAGHSELMSDKWGCRATRELLEHLWRWDTHEPKQARELAQIVLAWQTNFVLLARLDASRKTSDWSTLQLSFDEELREWEPPWERRMAVRKRSALPRLSCANACESRKHISRGGPFEVDLDALLPRYLRRWLAQSRWLSLRKVGRRGVLKLAWHVAWHQASGLDAPGHQVDVILPGELMAVRMRMLRTRDGKRRATVADQIGSRATIIAPGEEEDEETKEMNGAERQKEEMLPPPPTLFSLVITQRSAASWYGGVWIALLTGIAILTSALWWLPGENAKSTDAITILIVATTLVATLLSVRAGSEIAEQLTATLRRLIGAVGVLAAVCAVGLVAHHQPRKGSTSPISLATLEWLWIASAIVLLLIALALLVGALRIKNLLDFGRRASPRAVPKPCPGTVLSPEKAPRIPPPDRWLAADEGELVPWGWLNGPPTQTSPQDAWADVDACFWERACRRSLIEWVQEIFHYTSGKGAADKPC
jgi:hypothetical protein